MRDGEASVKNLLQTLMQKKTELISDVEYLAQTVNYQTFQEYNCQRALLFYKNHLSNIWSEYRTSLNETTLTVE